MITRTYDLVINQGADERLFICLKDAACDDIDLTGYTAAMQIRTSVTAETAADTLTTENGRLVITPDDGKIEVIFPHDVTAAYDFKTAVYDFKLKSSGNQVYTVLSGKVHLIKEVTRGLFDTV